MTGAFISSVNEKKAKKNKQTYTSCRGESGEESESQVGEKETGYCGIDQDQSGEKHHPIKEMILYNRIK